MLFERELMRTLVMGGMTPGTVMRTAAGTLRTPPDSCLEKAHRGNCAPVQTTRSGQHALVMRVPSTSKVRHGRKD